MKKISRRALTAVALVLFLLLGLVFFTGSWLLQGKDWVYFSGSPHVYENGRFAVGTVVDRDGNLLLDYGNNKTYAEDATLRAATVHLLGDRSGNIPNLFTETYAKLLTGYNILEGVYGAGEQKLRLTLASSVQKAAWEAMDGHNGTVAVYNYQTGEILCAVTTPAYDPDYVPETIADGTYVNRFLQGAYTPGSIFKLVTTVAAMEYVPDILSRTFICEGEMAFGIDKVICHSTHGELDLPTALGKSCNCAYAQIALLVGADNLEATAHKLGMTTSFAVDGANTRKGQFDLSVPAEVNVAWAGIGQYTDLVNPYAYLRFMGAIAGGGQGAEPYFVESAGSYSVTRRVTPQLMSQEAALALQAFMKNNVQTIYGAWKFPDISVCAKSGTAEVGEGLLPHATFAGFCMDENYPLAFMVVAENGGAGSDVAAPIAGKVLLACVSYMDEKSVKN